MLQLLTSEVRVAIRTLAKRPAFSAIVAATLALGIGATSAIFSVLYGIALRPLPFEAPDRLVVVWESNPTRGYEFMAVAPPNLADWREAATSFEDIAAYHDVELTLTTEAGTELLRASRMTPALPDLLGVRPLFGRSFVERDGDPGAPGAVLLTEPTWRRLFGADPAIVGRVVTADGRPAQIVGVTPASFEFPLPIAFMGPAVTRYSEAFIAGRRDELGARGARYLRAIGRLRPGVGHDAAERELAAVAARLEREYADSNAGWTVRVVPFGEEVSGDTRPALLVLFGAVAIVLLLACTNAAHLMLARSLDRAREVAVRIAMGASRLRLARQFLTEGLLLAALGAAGGVLLASWSLRLLLRIAPASIPRLSDVRIDGWTLAAALAAGVFAALLSSLAPIAHAWRTQTLVALRERAATGSSGTRAFQRLIIAAEAAMAVVLVALASLVGQSFLTLRGIDPGFRPDNLLMFHVNATGSRYDDSAGRSAFLETLLERLRALPGVDEAGTIDAAPFFDDRQGTSFEIEGEAPFPPEARPAINFSFVSPGYFATLGIAVVEGRAFTVADREGAEPVTIVNVTFARQFFPGASPVGRQVRLGFQGSVARRIVGVVGDERHESIGEAPRAGAYTPALQLPTPRTSVFLRTTPDPSSLTAPVRAAIREIDSGLAVFDIQPMSEVVASAYGSTRFAAELTGGFALLALLLAVAGVFGVASHGAAARTLEIGVRMALGATARDVRRAVVGPTLWLVAAGVAAGLAVAAVAARGLGPILYATSPVSPLTYGSAAVLVVAAAAVATWLPARRAARIDPLAALRQE